MGVHHGLAGRLTAVTPMLKPSGGLVPARHEMRPAARGPPAPPWSVEHASDVPLRNDEGALWRLGRHRKRRRGVSTGCDQHREHKMGSGPRGVDLLSPSSASCRSAILHASIDSSRTDACARPQARRPGQRHRSPFGSPRAELVHGDTYPRLLLAYVRYLGACSAGGVHGGEAWSGELSPTARSWSCGRVRRSKGRKRRPDWARARSASLSLTTSRCWRRRSSASG